MKPPTWKRFVFGFALLPYLLPTGVAAQGARVLEGPEVQEALTAHNDARARFGVAPLTWSVQLAEAARRCVVENTDRRFRHCDTPYGENMYGATAGARASVAVKAWMDEEPLYDIARARCRDLACGHFSQVVWNTTTTVGCALGPGERGWTNVICNYEPGGNYGYMSDESGRQGADGPWFYFDPKPFSGTPAPPEAPAPAAREPLAPRASALLDRLRPGTTRPGAQPETSSAIAWTVPWSKTGEMHRSGTILHGETSTLSATVSGPGTLTFRWRVSSEVGDVLTFSVNGALVLEPISGNQPWTDVTVDLPSGSHTLSWSYGKDAATSGGEDRAWVDRVNFSRR